MSHVTLNVAFRTLSGRVGDAVFYTRYGRQYMRPYVKPSNPDTPAQRARRFAFRNAVRAWQALGDEEKLQWKNIGRKRHLPGYNAFISHAMSGEPHFLQESTPYMVKADSARRTTYLRRPKCAGRVSNLLKVRPVIAPYPCITRDKAPYLPAIARHNRRL